MTDKETDWKSGLIKGPQARPPRIVIYGGHGIGKSTLASKFPNPIFISTEDGLTSIDTTSFPKADNLSEVVDAIKKLMKEPHDFKTVVLDSVDWLVEPLITEHIEGSFEAKDLAYGKGNMLIAEEFRKILQGFDVLIKKRNMNVVIIAHAAVVRYENPMTEPYDQFRPKLPNRCNALLQEWADVMAYAAFKVIVKKTDAGFNNTVNRGVTTGDRLLHLIEAPAYIAKNRYSTPDTVPMTFEDLSKHIPVIV
jgi:hypothetical protein